LGTDASFEAFTAVMFQVEVFWVVTSCCVVLCCVVLCRIPMFQSSTLKMEAAWTSETFVSYHNPEDLKLEFW